MKTTKLALILSFLFISLTASFAQIKEERKVEKFDKISIATGIQAKYTQGDKYSLTIEAKDQEILDKVRSSVSNGILSIVIENNTKLFFKTTGKIVAYITCPEVNGVTASSGSDFNANKLTASKDLKISLSSGASCDIDNTTANKGVLIKCSSGSDAELNGLKSNNLSISTSSGSSCEIMDVNVKENIDVSSSSGSDVEISGKCKTMNLKASSGATIDIKDLKADSSNVSKSSGGSVRK